MTFPGEDNLNNVSGHSQLLALPTVYKSLFLGSGKGPEWVRKAQTLDSLVIQKAVVWASCKISSMKLGGSCVVSKLLRFLNFRSGHNRMHSSGTRCPFSFRILRWEQGFHQHTAKAGRAQTRVWGGSPRSSVFVFQNSTMAMHLGDNSLALTAS